MKKKYKAINSFNGRLHQSKVDNLKKVFIPNTSKMHEHFNKAPKNPKFN